MDKTCLICDKKFSPYRTTQKVCSLECAKTLKKETDKAYRKKTIDKYGYKPTTVYHKICELCGKEYRTKHKEQRKCSRKCFFDEAKETRKGDSNPAYRNGKFVDRKDPKNREEFNYKYREFQKNAKKILQKQLDTVGCSYCERCNTTQSMRRETHHIVYRSEKPKHQYLHDERNLIRLCIQCHNEFHKHKASRKSLVEKRNLVELFGPLSHT